MTDGEKQIFVGLKETSENHINTGHHLPEELSEPVHHTDPAILLHGGGASEPDKLSLSTLLFPSCFVLLEL